LHPYVLVPLFSGVAAAVFASAILTRDPRNRAHQLSAAILGCAAYWSLLEVIWNAQDDAAWVPQLVRLSSFGWMPLGVLSFHLLLELGADTRKRLRSLLPALYAGTAVLILSYAATPWGVAGAVRTEWGWSFQYGPLFLLQYTPVATLAALSMTFLWWRVYPRQAPRSEVRQWIWGLVAMCVALGSASITDAMLPYFGIHVPRLGSASITLVGATVAWSTLRYGHSVLAPGTYAPQILASMRDGVALLRQDGIIRTVNASLARICECRPEDLLGRPVSLFLPDLVVELTGEVEDLECQLVSQRGNAMAVSISSAFLVDRHGEPIGRVISVRDVRDVVALRNRLVMSGRLAAVGQLAAGIAHEINNPIAYMQANLNQLGKHWHDLAEHLEARSDVSQAERMQEGSDLIQESLTGASRVAAIVQDVRGFAHAGSGRHELGDINALLETTLRVAGPRLRYSVEVECDYSILPAVRCNPQELKQVFLNVLLNAADAISGAGTIRVSTRPEAGWVVASIEDDGCGMSPEVRERIFDPFYTTKPAGEGLGLGLSLSYEMVRRHGGDIEVDSEPGRGTCFRIRLPLGQDPGPAGGRP
jgi:signal transduction histidine kinase